LRVFPNQTSGTPLPDSKAELPPVIRRAEVVAFALVSLLVICVVAVLYVAKAFFLPVVTAFVVGTMLSPAAGFLERRRIPRAVAAVLIVLALGAGVAFMVGLISSPLMEWSTRLPELGSLLREKLHIFDRPLALWQELLPVADLHRVPAILCHPGVVHRELAGPAARLDHDVRRTCRAPANVADPE